MLKQSFVIVYNLPTSQQSQWWLVVMDKIVPYPPQPITINSQSAFGSISKIKRNTDPQSLISVETRHALIWTSFWHQEGSSMSYINYDTIRKLTADERTSK